MLASNKSMFRKRISNNKNKEYQNNEQSSDFQHQMKLFVRWSDYPNNDKRRYFCKDNNLDSYVLRDIEATLDDLLRRLNCKSKKNTFLRYDRLSLAICAAFFKNFSSFELVPKFADVVA